MHQSATRSVPAPVGWRPSMDPRILPVLAQSRLYRLLEVHPHAGTDEILGGVPAPDAGVPP